MKDFVYRILSSCSPDLAPPDERATKQFIRAERRDIICIIRNKREIFTLSFSDLGRVSIVASGYTFTSAKLRHN